MKGVFVQTFGCQMNVSDSDRMKAVVAPLGFEEVASAEEADLILINTCSIRETAEQRMTGSVRDLKNLKLQRPDLLIGITGCVAQQEKEKILQDLPFVDIVLGPDNVDELPWALEAAQTQREAIVRADFDQGSRVWNTQTRPLRPGVTAFVSVMKGCDHFCSYCIVPHVRGREKSRPLAEVVDDVRHLVSRGVKEITFLGQNINTYGKRSGESLAQLFRHVHEVEGLERIRFTTSHPGDLKDDLIGCFEDLPKLCSYFHLPLQSGSDRVLREMRRFYTVDQYRERAAALRRARPDIAFSTDFIVGFPGETEEDFARTLELAREIRFDNVYAFIFSPRPGTSAALRPDSLSYQVKVERLSRLQEICRQVSLDLHQALLGQQVEVLIEGPSRKDAQRWTGKTSQNVSFHFSPEDSLHLKKGELVQGLVTQATLTHLSGDLSHRSGAKRQSDTSRPILSRISE